ncbi:MAG TPA: LamG-like jellyroll fold domain-containing protein, partial [Verrucomicrobiae bacterium]
VKVLGNTITLPGAPTGLTAMAGYGMINLNWSAPAGADSYRILRSTSAGQETVITNLTGTTFTDAGLKGGMRYFYQVTAVNLQGAGPVSAEVNAVPLMPAPGSYPAALLALKPLAYWLLGETNGAIAFDSVGGYNGVYLGGASLGQMGVSGAGMVPASRAVLFDGASGYVDIPSGPFNLTNALTVIAWAKVPAISHFSGVVGRGDSSWRLTINNSGQPGAANGGSADATSANGILGSAWHMLAYTCSGLPGVANNGALYVDGIKQANHTVPANNGNSADPFIGGVPDYGTGRLLAGTLAQVAVFTNALAAGQIAALYNASTTAPPATLALAPGGAGSLNVIWWQGQLLSATNLIGPWVTNELASPYTVMPTGGQYFFRTQP